MLNRDPANEAKPEAPTLQFSLKVICLLKEVDHWGRRRPKKFLLCDQTGGGCAPSIHECRIECVGEMGERVWRVQAA